MHIRRLNKSTAPWTMIHTMEILETYNMNVIIIVVSIGGLKYLLANITLASFCGDF